MSSIPVSEWIGWLFVVSNGGRLFAYIPQIVATARCEVGARSVSVLTWGYFAVAHFTALLYAMVVLHDGKSSLIFFGNLAVTLILVAVIVVKRRTHGRRCRATPRPARVAARADALPDSPRSVDASAATAQRQPARTATARPRRQDIGGGA